MTEYTRSSNSGEKNGASYHINGAPYQQSLNGQSTPIGNGQGVSTQSYRLQKRVLNTLAGD